jgi:hypothetical protein
MGNAFGQRGRRVYQSRVSEVFSARRFGIALGKGSGAEPTNTHERASQLGTGHFST